MVRHGTNKKRRRGQKVTRKAQKHVKVRIANKVPDVIKTEWDKSKSPVENLASFGLQSDPNMSLSGTHGVGRKHVKPKDGSENHSAAFLGMFIVPRDGADAMKEHNPKLKLLAETDQRYAAALIAKYGEDYGKMHRDIKLNFNQLTEHKCKTLCEKYASLTEKDRLV